MGSDRRGRPVESRRGLVAHDERNSRRVHVRGVVGRRRLRRGGGRLREERSCLGALERPVGREGDAKPRLLVTSLTDDARRRVRDRAQPSCADASSTFNAPAVAPGLEARKSGAKPLDARQQTLSRREQRLAGLVRLDLVDDIEGSAPLKERFSVGGRGPLDSPQAIRGIAELLLQLATNVAPSLKARR
jgi:hypothetical protein